MPRRYWKVVTVSWFTGWDLYVSFSLRAIDDYISLQFMTNFCLLDPRLRLYLVRRLDGVYLKDGMCQWQVSRSTNSNYGLIS
jgi:hypothetical protein